MSPPRTSAELLALGDRETISPLCIGIEANAGDIILIAGGLVPWSPTHELIRLNQCNASTKPSFVCIINSM
jgi:hypothetical protein